MLAIDNRRYKYYPERLRQAFRHVDAQNKHSHAFNGDCIYYIENDIIKLICASEFNEHQKLINHLDFFNPDEILSWNHNNFETYPEDIKSLMLQRQCEAGYERDPEIFIKYVSADAYQKGFSWSNTPERYTFWGDIIDRGKFYIFYNKYRKNQFNSNLNINNNEIELQNKTGIISRGNEPKGHTICGKKSIVAITSGYISFGRSIRGV